MPKHARRESMFFKELKKQDLHVGCDDIRAQKPNDEDADDDDVAGVTEFTSLQSRMSPSPDVLFLYSYQTLLQPHSNFSFTYLRTKVCI